ncbi:MAG: hypothetical protein COT74_06345 [Bdellovibrionales bacterium CG10_big_fil_rev_8_21_14_0_10_45_34]|nr:MAG: hypothetical protein COT74_06345 [Bdellovibrionales bacterium CG10_big_fil_rev_8_21_14_0_10_45_34]
MPFPELAETGEIMAVLECEHFPACSGCQYLDKPLELQQVGKVKDALSALSADLAEQIAVPVSVIGVGLSSLRTRFDFAVDPVRGTYRFGLWNKAKKEVVDILSCPQLHPQLNSAFQEFRAFPPPIEKRGSVRIRVSPKGEKGAWLDFSNEDIDRLLKQNEWVGILSQKGWRLEFGQRHKSVTVKTSGSNVCESLKPEKNEDALSLEDSRNLKQGEGNLRLGLSKELKPHAWFETTTFCSKAISETIMKSPLFSTIGTFTQPSWVTQDYLVKEVAGQVLHANNEHEVSNWIEIGCGIGQLTIPLLSMGFNVLATDSSEQALSFLERSFQEFKGRISIQTEVGKLSLKKIDFRKPRSVLLGGQYKRFRPHEKSFNWQSAIESKPFGVLIDPPRSGLGELSLSLEKFFEEKLPKTIIYVCCSPAEVMAKDIKVLKERCGYHLSKLTLVDQFPQTEHSEWVLQLVR